MQPGASVTSLRSAARHERSRRTAMGRSAPRVVGRWYRSFVGHVMMPKIRDGRQAKLRVRSCR